MWKGLKQHCTAQAGQTNGIQGRVDNHSAAGPSIAGEELEERREDEEREADDPQEVNPEAPPDDSRTRLNQRAKSLKTPTRRNRIKWPKSNETEEWGRLNDHLCKLLQKTLRGPVEAKLNLLGRILYEECSSRFGKAASGTTGLTAKGRREKAIDDLVMNRRQHRKRWRKADETQKEGLKALWDEIRKRLAVLRRAESIRRRRKRKEKERANFFRNPFRHARGLLKEETSGSLEISKEELERHIHAQYSDPARNEQLGPPGYVPKPAEPAALFDTSVRKM